MSMPRAGGLAALFYLVAALVITWPIVTDLGSSIVGLGGDTWSQVFFFRELLQDGETPFAPGVLTDLGAPEGQPIPYAQNISSWVGTGTKWLLAAAFGPVAAVNLFVLLGFVLTGTLTFLLLRRTLGDWRVALLGGWAFAFCPYFVGKGLGHTDLMHGWGLVIVLWAALAVRERPTLKRGAALGAATAVAIAFNSYLMLIAGVLWAALVVWDLVLAARDSDLARHVKAQAVAAGLVVSPLAAYGLVALSAGDASGGLRSHPLSELVIFSARPLNYVVPPVNSPLFGGATEEWWRESSRAALDEVTVYVGISVLVLALVAVGLAVAGRLEQPLRRLVFGMSGVAVVGALFSGPPQLDVLGVSLKMPSWFVFQVTSTWRVYSRFGALVMLAVVVLAAIALYALVRGRRAQVANAVVAVVALVVVVDLWVRPPVTTTALPNSPVYATLADQGPGIAAEYPLYSQEIPEYRWAQLQDRHDHPILNGFPVGSSEEKRALWIGDLRENRVSSWLSLLGVRYVVLHKGRPPTEAVPDPGAPGPGFELLDDDATRQLWKVTARPAESFVWPSEGFWEREGIGKFRAAWMVRREATISVQARCASCPGTLEFLTTSFGRSRTVTFSAPDGRVLRRERVGTGTQGVRVPLPAAGLDAVEVSVTPPPEPAPDGRSLGVKVIGPTFEPAP